jgi:hypothetical protein
MSERPTVFVEAAALFVEAAALLVEVAATLAGGAAEGEELAVSCARTGRQSAKETRASVPEQSFINRLRYRLFFGSTLWQMRA